MRLSLYMKIEPLVRPCGKLPILIRDDDTNFFTKNSMLQSIYSEAWNKGFKVSLSVIPSQKGFDDLCVPPEAGDANANGNLDSIPVISPPAPTDIARRTITIRESWFLFLIICIKHLNQYNDYTTDI